MPTAQADLNTSGSRLRWAITQQSKQGRRSGLRLFVHKLEQLPERVRGASLPSVTAYMNDDVPAPTAFLEAAAAVLRVRREWLTFGMGHPTDANAAVTVADTKRLGDTTGQTVGDDLFSPKPALSAAELRSQRKSARQPEPRAPWVADVEHLVRRFPHSDLLDNGGNFNVDIRRRVSKALFAPLRELGVKLGWDTPADQDEIDDYLQSMIPPLLVVARIHRRIWDEAVLRAERSERARQAASNSRPKKRRRSRTT